MNDAERSFVEQLYMRLAGMMMATALHELGDEQLAEEAVQDTFRILCSKVAEVMKHPNPAGWVVTTLMNTIRKIPQQRGRTESMLVRFRSEQLTRASSAASAEDELDPDVKYADLADDDDYILLKRFSAAQCTIVEFAKELGISVDACGKRLQRARKKLRKYFEENA